MKTKKNLPFFFCIGLLSLVALLGLISFINDFTKNEETITLTFVADSGYTLDSVFITDSKKHTTAIKSESNLFNVEPGSTVTITTRRVKKVQ